MAEVMNRIEMLNRINLIVLTYSYSPALSLCRWFMVITQLAEQLISLLLDRQQNNHFPLLN